MSKLVQMWLGRSRLCLLFWILKLYRIVCITVILCGESIQLSHTMSVHIHLNLLINRPDIKDVVRQIVPVIIKGTYAETIAPDHLLGMGFEEFISMTSGGAGGGVL